MNTNWTDIMQANFNQSGHDSTAFGSTNSGGNAVLGGLIGLNALNPATATAAGVNLSPVTQANVGADVDSIISAEAILDLL
ncbi:MAG TPA: hypothetical protein VLQ65_00450 [Saliniramus sp.]|nr:hypothetical protein [Saliniramus sp.]